ncbi:MAG: outer membrane protein transport protein [Nitrospirae bacterium]|nr:outer membrane protein transport protein [Nitrospirota bacterium]
MRSCYRLFLCLLVLALVLTVSFGIDPTVCRAADKPEFGSSPNPVGSGARALGMGGAFIGVADDATAASWNPAGLIQLGTPEVSIVGSTYSRSEDGKFATEKIDSAPQSVSETNLNYLSGVYPTDVFGRNIVLSMSYQHLYDFNRKWELSNFPIGTDSADISYRQKGGISALGLSAAMQLSEKISAGLTLNTYNNGLTQNNWQDTMEIKDSTWRNQDKYTLSGYNANLGLMWMINEEFTVGAVFKTPFRAGLVHEYPSCDENNVCQTHKLYEKLYMPMSYGVGVAYRHDDPFTLALDVYRTHWEQFKHIAADGTETSAVTNTPVGDADIKPTLQVRLGAEYLLICPKITIPLRAGVFYDQAPAPQHPDDYYGMSVGTGLAFGRFAWDIAYQYRWGSNVGSALAGKSWNYSQDVREHTVYTSLIVHL